MKGWLRSKWLWMFVSIVCAIVLAGVLFVRRDVINVMHPALDTLSSIPLRERWSHPALLNIRALGSKAVPNLRRVLREGNSPTTLGLLWVKAHYPRATNLYKHFPDPARIAERRWVACQVLQTLGPAGRSAVPEIVDVLGDKDGRSVNAATMALYAIGIDADVCERLNRLLDRGVSNIGRPSVLRCLQMVKPPSPRTVKALVSALSDSSPYVQQTAAEALGILDVNTPEVVQALKQLQSTATDPLAVLSASAALWRVERDATVVLNRVCPLLEAQLTAGLQTFGPGNGGQGVSGPEQLFMQASELFRGMDLPPAEKARALRILERCCEQSGRIFIRMLLLPAMIDLGFDREKCLEVCQTGLRQEEVYYRLQAAQLLEQVGQKYSVDEIHLDALIHDRDVGVRIYAAKLHWLKKHQSAVVVPVLVEALDRSKHQSYYYAQTQPAAVAALGDIGPEAADAIPSLEMLCRDPNPSITNVASQALLKIRK
jgi:hypothetical protein